MLVEPGIAWFAQKQREMKCSFAYVAKMDYPQMGELLALQAVAEAGSFSRAADRLGLSTSVVSRRIGQLEVRVGSRLLNRSTRSVSLTPTGENYLSRVREALDTIAQAGDAASGETVSPRGHLRVSLPVNFGRVHFVPRLGEFLERFPAVTLDVRFDDRFVDLVAEGLDLAIRIGELEDSRLVAKRIGQERRLVVASPTYLSRAGTPKHPDDLRGHECFHYNNFRGPATWLFRQDGRRLEVAVRGRLQSNYGLPLTMAAEQGLGVVMTAESLVRDALRDGCLVEVLASWRLPDVGVYAVYPSRRSLPERVRAFIDFTENDVLAKP